MYKITFFILTFGAAFSCTSPKAGTSFSSTDTTATAAIPKSGSVTIRNMSRFPDIQKQNNLGKVVKELETSECVNENGVGFAAEYTRTFALYERLGQLATEQQLLALVKNKSAVVRVYAFRALSELKYSSANSGKSILDSDTNHVCWYVGCVMTDTIVSFFSKSEE